MRKQPIFLLLFFVSILSLFFYSFTQIDLSLTFSRASFLQDIQKVFQYVGWFNRPLSAGLFVGILTLLFGTYIYSMHLVRLKKLHARDVLILTCTTAMILLVAYNAFSYDLFNYIFDAKIVTHYNQNPYEHKALDFPTDPMLSFMRWTHRTYPYGPLWLGLTIPLSYIGMQYFAPTLLLFKLLAILSYIGSVFLIGRTLRIVKPEYEALGMAFFAFNPLVIIESLVSAHNDIVMLFFALLSIYLLVKKQVISSYVLFLVSIGIKFATGILLPLFAWITYATMRKKKIKWDVIFLLMTLLLSAAVILASYRTTFQPWYMLYFLMPTALLAEKKYIVIPAIILSVTALCNYLPFLYTGNWDPPIPQLLLFLNTIAFFLSVLFGLYMYKTQSHE
jgi:hypothetical protein